MEGEELREGKARVRNLLIAPLECMGLERKRGVSLAEYDAFLNDLEARLAYMRADRLVALAEVIERHAVGKERDRWPKMVSILAWARRLQEPPASESRLVRTYLQSAAGQAAQSGGYLVELFHYLKHYGHPPPDFAMSQIKTKAEENMRDRLRIERLAKSGRATQAERARLDAYSAALVRCENLVAAGGQGA